MAAVKFVLSATVLTVLVLSTSGLVEDPRTAIQCLEREVEFACKDHKQCVKAKFLCDGVPHCRDRSDEEECENNDHCKDKEWFKCKTTPVGSKFKCINPAWVCDGNMDCPDRSDEQDCGVDSALPSIKTTTCSDKEFQCSNGLCIPATMVCDDVSDCMDGSDEERSFCESRPCSGTQFNCEKDKRCIPERWVCDNKPDCSDGADEVNCGQNSTTSSVLCSFGDFDCNDGKTCLTMSKVCDGTADCINSNDESDNCDISCKNAECESSCLKMPVGAGTCTCPKGYKLASNGKQCVDEDECLKYGVCSQRCVNKIGTFKCECEEGYEITPSGKTCKATGRIDAMLLFAGKSEIRGINIRTGAQFVVTKERQWTNTAIGIAYDALDDRVFWTALDNTKSRIVSARRDGMDKRVVVTDLVMPESLAIDHVARNIYYSEPAEDYIGVCTIDGRWCTKLHYQGVRQPREIALYTPAGLLFYTDWGLDPKISRVGMDGSMAKTVISHDLHWPNGITVDSTIKRIFWSDAKHDLLESSFFDGSDRRRTEVNVIRHPFSLAVFEDRLYWSDWDLKKIQSCNKFTGKDPIFLFNDTAIEPFGIHIYHPVLEHEVNGISPCVDSLCSHMCLLAYGGRSFTCKCPGNMTLSSDRKNCIYNQKRTTTTPTPTTTATKLLPTINGGAVRSNSEAVEAMKYDQRIKIGLAIGIPLVLTLFCFVALCIASFRRKNHMESSPVLRYKNPAFGYEESSIESEDMDLIVDGGAKKTEGDELTRNLNGNWPAVVESRNGEDDELPKSGTLGFKVWRPRSNRYYKL